jgi:hypothetical protein
MVFLCVEWSCSGTLLFENADAACSNLRSLQQEDRPPGNFGSFSPLDTHEVSRRALAEEVVPWLAMIRPPETGHML